MLFNETRRDGNFEKNINAQIALVTVNSAPRNLQDPIDWKVIYETYLEEQLDSQMEHIKIKTPL